MCGQESNNDAPYQHNKETVHNYESIEDREEDKGRRLFPSYRLRVALIFYLGALCAYTSQATLGTSLLMMLKQEDDFTARNSTVNDSGNITTSNGTSYGSGNITTSNEPDGTNCGYYDMSSKWRFSWDKETQGWILSSYFIGYYLMQLFIGWLISCFGGKRVCLVGSLVQLCLQFVVIATAREDPTWFIVTMVMTGTANGCIMSSTAGVFGKWIPPHENGRMASLVFSGVGTGVAFSNGLSAITSQVRMFGGWPWNFVTLGVLLGVFCCLWAVYVTDTPADNIRICPKERAYIEKCLLQHGCHTLKIKKDVPWLKIVTSMPVWAFSIAQFGADWFMYCVITIVPSYFKYVIDMEITKVNMLSGLPFLGMPVLGTLVSTLVDKLRTHELFSTLCLRKLSVFCQLALSSACLVLMSSLTQNNTVCIILLFTMAVLLFCGFYGCGWAANITELSPEYAGILAAFSQVVAMPSSFIAPLVLTALTPNNSPEEWQMCFGVMAAVTFTTFLVYAMCSSDRYQNWNSEETEILLTENGKTCASLN